MASCRKQRAERPCPPPPGDFIADLVVHTRDDAKSRKVKCTAVTEEMTKKYIAAGMAPSDAARTTHVFIAPVTASVERMRLMSEGGKHLYYETRGPYEDDDVAIALAVPPWAPREHGKNPESPYWDAVRKIYACTGWLPDHMTDVPCARDCEALRNERMFVEAVGKCVACGTLQTAPTHEYHWIPCYKPGGDLETYHMVPFHACTKKCAHRLQKANRTTSRLLNLVRELLARRTTAKGVAKSLYPRG